MNIIIRMITMYTTDRVNLGNTMNIYKQKDIKDEHGEQEGQDEHNKHRNMLKLITRGR